MSIDERPASSIQQEIIAVELSSVIGNEQVILEESTDTEGKAYGSFAIQRYCAVMEEWLTEYVWTVENPSSIDMENGYWDVTGTPVVLLKAMHDNGLNYRIVGYAHGKLNEFVVRDNLERGNVFFYGGSILEQSGGQYSVWTLIDSELTLVPY